MQKTCKTSLDTAENKQYFHIFCIFSAIPAYFLHIFCNTYRFSVIPADFLGSFGRIVCKPSPNDSFLLRGVARWIPRHERRGCTISRRGSYHLPFAKMVSERWFTRVRWSDGRGRWRQRVAGLIHQTFTSSKYHGVVLVPGHVSTREIRKVYFQERPLHRSLQKSTRSIRDEEFTASSFSLLLGRHDGRVSKSDRTTVWVHGPRFTSCQWRQETRI